MKEYRKYLLALNCISFKKVANYLKFKNDLKNRQIITSSFPPSITFQSSAYCNSNCRLCPVGLGIKGPRKGFLKFSTFQKVIDETKDFLIGANFADWGEPFLNPYIFDMIKYAESKRILTFASTNLHFFENEDDFERILNCGLSSLTLSLHGVSQETYGAYQPGKNFRETMEKIKTLTTLKRKMKRRKPILRLVFAITKKNQHEIEKMREFAKKFGVYCDIYTASLNLRFYLGNADGIMKMINNWAQNENLDLCENAKFGKELVDGLYLKISAERDVSFAELDRLGLLAKHFCSDPWQSLTVNWDGTVSLCCVDYGKYVMGDTQKESVIELWNNERYQTLRKYLLGKITDRAVDFPCKNCIKY